jgi:hypothetical protein
MDLELNSQISLGNFNPENENGGVIDSEEELDED